MGMDAAIKPGEVLTLMGPSGSGKSTIISAIAGFLPAAFSCTGNILLNGNNIASLPPQQRKIGVLFRCFRTHYYSPIFLFCKIFCLRSLPAGRWPSAATGHSLCLMTFPWLNLPIAIRTLYQGGKNQELLWFG